MTATPSHDDARPGPAAGHVRLLEGDALVRLAELEDGSVDACVTDPPAGISFMGKAWDSDKGGRRQWVAWMTEVFTEVHRVMKPGAHGLVWALPRTSHWTAWALEDAGFEVRDKVLHLFGSGFPKSLDVSKAIDKMRDDKADVQHVRRWLEEQRQRVGLSRKAINEAMGLASNGGGLASTWTTNSTTAAVPQWDQWLALKALLGFGDEMDAEVWRLNGRKGQPGEAWNDRERVRYEPRPATSGTMSGKSDTRPWIERSREIGYHETAGPNGATDAAREWQGWGTALKPGYEDWWLIRKPLAGTVAQNVLKHGTGALNVDGCRITATQDDDIRHVRSGGFNDSPIYGTAKGAIPSGGAPGRWPSHVVLSHEPECREVGTKRVKGAGGSDAFSTALGRLNDDAWQPKEVQRTKHFDADGFETVVAWECAPSCAVRLLDEQGGERKSGAPISGREPSHPHTNVREGGQFGRRAFSGHADTGGASRFFLNVPADDEATRFMYCAKASASERRPYNDWATVKPLKLMSWLCRLVTPPGGTVLDPFSGSGSTLIAADREGFSAIGIDSDPHAIEIARRRIADDAGPLMNPLLEATP